MQDLVLPVLALVIVACGWGLLTLLRTWARGRRAIAARRGPYELREEPEGDQLVLYAERPDHREIRIGSVPFGAEDFDEQLYELRAQARLRLRALNRG